MLSSVSRPDTSTLPSVSDTESELPPAQELVSETRALETTFKQFDTDKVRRGRARRAETARCCLVHIGPSCFDANQFLSGAGGGSGSSGPFAGIWDDLLLWAGSGEQERQRQRRQQQAIVALYAFCGVLIPCHGGR